MLKRYRPIDTIASPQICSFEYKYVYYSKLICISVNANFNQSLFMFFFLRGNRKTLSTIFVHAKNAMSLFSAAW